MKIPRILYYIPKKILIKIIFALFLFCCSLIYVNAESTLKPSSYYMMIPNIEDDTYYQQPSEIDETNPWYGVDYISGFGYRSYWTTAFNPGDTLKFQVRLCSANPDFGDSLSSISPKVTGYSYNTSNAATGATIGNPNDVIISYNKYNDNCGTFNFTVLNPVSGRYYGFVLDFNTKLRISPSSSSSGFVYISSSQAVVTEGTNAYIELMNEQSKQNTQDIINNQQQNTDDIINNQNQNNQDLQDTINDNFNNCRPSHNLFPGWLIGQGINSNNGSIVSNENGAISSDFIAVDFSKNINYTLSGLTTNLRTFIAAYNSNKQFLGRTGANYSGLVTFNNTSFVSGTPQGTGDIAYIRITSYNPRDGSISQVNNLKTMLNTGSTALKYEEYGKEVCQNKIDETNDKLDNLTGAITDSSSPNVDNLENAAGWLPPGPVDTIANLPITFFQTLLGKINKSCTPIKLDLPFVNQELTLPCASTILSQLGNFNGWWEGFGFIAAAWCLYKYFINFYKWVESALSMDEKEQLGKWGGV